MTEFVFVCKDVNGPTEWFYEPSRERYYRLDGNGEIIARISGGNLPDPMQLWENKATKAGTTTQTEIGQKLKPQLAVFKLWEHYQSVHDNN